MYNMNMVDKIIVQVSINVHIMIRETFKNTTMDAEHNETNPTITFYRYREDSGIHITHIYRKT